MKSVQVVLSELSMRLFDFVHYDCSVAMVVCVLLLAVCCSNIVFISYELCVGFLEVLSFVFCTVMMLGYAVYGGHSRILS